MSTQTAQPQTPGQSLQAKLVVHSLGSEEAQVKTYHIISGVLLQLFHTGHLG